jgi:hypothetical protein
MTSEEELDRARVVGDDGRRLSAIEFRFVSGCSTPAQGSARDCESPAQTIDR